MHRRIARALALAFTGRFTVKLLAAFVGVAAFAGIGGVYGLATQSRLTHEVRSTNDRSLVPLQSLEEARARTLVGRVDALQAMEATDSATRADASMRVRTADLAVDDMLDTFGQAELTPGERSSLAKLHAHLVTYRRAVNNLLGTKGKAGARRLVTASDTAFAAVDADFVDLAGQAVSAGAANYKHARRVAHDAGRTTLTLLALAFLVSLLVSFALARRLSRPVIAASKALRAVAEGDLTPRLPVRGRDEMALMAS